MRWVLLVLFASRLSAEIGPIPDQFRVIERFPSLLATFDISSELERFAVARKQLFSLTTAFDLEDPDGILLATAKARLFSWGTTADLFDPEGKKIGWIEENLVRLIPWAEYRIFNESGEFIALAKMNFWGTKFEVTEPEHPEHIYAVIKRPFIRFFRDFWTVQIHEPFDPKILILISVFQTSKDYRDKIKKEIQEQLLLELNNFEGTRLAFFSTPPASPILTPLLNELDDWAKELKVEPYDSWETLEQDLDCVSPLCPTSEILEPLSYFTSTLENGLKMIRNPSTPVADRLRTARILKEFVLEYENF